MRSIEVDQLNEINGIGHSIENYIQNSIYAVLGCGLNLKLFFMVHLY
jgi:hypothetical protein